MVVFQGPVLNILSKKYSECYLILAGNLILGVNFLMLLSENIYIIYTSTLFFAAGNGIMWPSVLSLLSKAAGKRFQGSVQGFASSLGSMASIAGLIAGGILYSSLGSLTFLVSAVTIYIVFILSFRLIKTQAYCEKKALTEPA